MILVHLHCVLFSLCHVGSVTFVSRSSIDGQIRNRGEYLKRIRAHLADRDLLRCKFHTNVFRTPFLEASVVSSRLFNSAPRLGRQGKMIRRFAQGLRVGGPRGPLYRVGRPCLLRRGPEHLAEMQHNEAYLNV